MAHPLSVDGLGGTEPPLFELWPPSRTDVAAAVANYIRNDGLLSIAGREGPVAALEDVFASATHRAFALALNSGTSAMLCALAACGVEDGDEVLGPTYAFHAAVTPALMRRARPVLIDCEVDWVNIDASALEGRVSRQTKAIVVVHNWGHVADMDAVCGIARSYGIPVIEDCSHAHGAEYKGRPVGSLGDIAIFSLQQGKLIAAGEGGILVTSSREYYERALLQGHYRGRLADELTIPDYQGLSESGWGMKLRIHPLAAVMALLHLPLLARVVERRGEILGVLRDQFSDLPGLRPPVWRPYATRHSFLGCRLQYVPEEVANLPIDAFVRSLQEEGLDVRRSTFRPLHELPILTGQAPGPFRAIPAGTIDPSSSSMFPNATALCASLLSMPTFWHPEWKGMIASYRSAIERVLLRVTRQRRGVSAASSPLDK